MSKKDDKKNTQQITWNKQIGPDGLPDAALTSVKNELKTGLVTMLIMAGIGLVVYLISLFIEMFP